MSSTYTDRYNTLVTKSQLKTNFGNDTYEAIDDRLISCKELRTFYKDSLFYMHLFNTLYLELLIIDKINGHEIEEFNKIIKNLNVIFDTTRTSFLDRNNRLGILQKNASTNNYTFTFYVKLFELYYHNDEAYSGYNNLATASTGNKIFMINVNLPSKDPNALNGTPAVIKIVVNMVTGTGNILILDQMTGAIKAGTSSTDKNYFLQNVGNKFPRNTKFYNSDYQPNLVDLRIGGSTFGHNFTDIIKDIYFTTDKVGAITEVKFLKSIRANPDDPANIFNQFTISQISEINNYKPKINNIPLFPTTFTYDFGNVFDTSIASPSPSGPIYNFSKGNTNFNLSENIYQNDYKLSQTRKKRFRKIMSDILNTPTTNIYGYLLYQKIYYNCIVCNTSIQIYLREKVLNNSTINFKTTDKVSAESLATTIITFINVQKGNLRSLRSIVGTAALDYVNDKNFAVDRIVLLNELKTDFNKTLESLNIVINNYNRYIKYYTMLKKYVSAIIVFIIFLMISSIMITVSPTIDYDAKNTYYTLIFIILIIITIAYYYKFRHVSLYEKFATADNESISGVTIRMVPSDDTLCAIINGKDSRDIATAAPGDNANIVNNNNNFATFSNKLFSDDLIDYNYVYLLLSNEINSAIFVSNNKVFSNGNNDYLYKLYTEKVRENDMNKLKGSKYGNIIEAIKKQIIYLFNIALLISLVTIVLVASLIIYNFGVVNIGYIFTFALISLMIVMFYVNYIMIQQTRMLSSKKYWSVNNPSEVTLDQL